METNATTSAVRELIAENKLEEALRLLMNAIKTRNDRSLDAVILLKGKLSLLEEQETAGLLEFEDILREKAKISRSLLDILSDLDSLPTTNDATAYSPAPARRGNNLRNFIFIAAGGLAVLAAVLFLFQEWEGPPASLDENSAPPGAETATPDEAMSPEAYNFTKPLPLNRPFRIADVDYDLQNVSLQKHSDPVPPDPGMVKLTYRAILIGRTKGTGGVSWREQKVRVLVDDEPYAPVSEDPVNGGWINLDARAETQLSFVFPDNGKKYQLEFSYEKQVRRIPFAFSGN